MPPFGHTAKAISVMVAGGGGGGPATLTTMSPPLRFLSVSRLLPGLASGVLAQKFCGVPRPPAASGSARLSWSGTPPSGGPLSTARHPSSCPMAVVSLAPSMTPADTDARVEDAKVAGDAAVALASRAHDEGAQTATERVGDERRLRGRDARRDDRA